MYTIHYAKREMSRIPWNEWVTCVHYAVPKTPLRRDVRIQILIRTESAEGS